MTLLCINVHLMLLAHVFINHQISISSCINRCLYAHPYRKVLTLISTFCPTSCIADVMLVEDWTTLNWKCLFSSCSHARCSAHAYLHLYCFPGPNQGCISFHVHIIMTEPSWFILWYIFSHASWVLVVSRDYRETEMALGRSHTQHHVLASRVVDAVPGTLGKLYRDQWDDRISSEEHVEMTGLVLKLSNARILICHHVCVCVQRFT